MILSPFDSCSNGCGVVFAFVGCLGFGSFGVPLKGKASNAVDEGRGADPFVLQTYKSSMCFLTCWIVLLLGETYTFSMQDFTMGLISGLLWVTGGITGIFGIRNAGLAISVGSWSSITVFVSFMWGMIVFHEKVESIVKTVGGIALMIVGFSGMTYFSTPESPVSSLPATEEDSFEDDSEHFCDPNSEMSLDGSDTLREPLLDDTTIEKVSDIHDDNADDIEMHTDPSSNNVQQSADHIVDAGKIRFLGVTWNRRLLGILGASLDGILGGSNLVPMHYAKAGGLEYVISFGIGAAIATLLGWVLRFLYNTYNSGSIQGGWDALPSMYFRELWIQGSIAGFLWSIGNIGQILSVSFLGESIGMSIVQSQMIVSGAWGILWFGEMKGMKPIFGWAMSALLVLVSIFLLSHEHKK